MRDLTKDDNNNHVIRTLPSHWASSNIFGLYKYIQDMALYRYKNGPIMIVKLFYNVQSSLNLKYIELILLNKYSIYLNVRYSAWLTFNNVIYYPALLSNTVCLDQCE